MKNPGDLMLTRICILLAFFFAISTLHACIDPWVELTPSDGYDEAIHFGDALSVSGSTALIGADRGYNEIGDRTGSAYIFEEVNGFWRETAKLTPNDGAPYDQFGSSVSVSGLTALIGAPEDDDNGTNSGSAYIFKNVDGTWLEMAKLTPNDGTAEDHFGNALSISGTIALIGAYKDDDNGTNSGSTYIFKNVFGTWLEMAKLTPNDGIPYDEFGSSVSVSGLTALIGAPGRNSGSAYIFEDVGGIWTQVAKLTPSDGTTISGFGTALSISGTTALIAASEWDASVYVFEKITGIWTETKKFTSLDFPLGDSIAIFDISIAGDKAIFGILKITDPIIRYINVTWASFIFERVDGIWTRANTSRYQYAPMQPVDMRFPNITVSISEESACVGFLLDDITDNFNMNLIFVLPLGQ